MVHHNRQVAHIARVLALLAACLVLGGCNPPLLSPDEPRSQFDRYDSLRNQHAEQYIFDEYGKRQPDLNRRLSPRD